MDRNIAVILLAFLATASAMIVCRPNFCDNVKCKPETKQTCKAKGQEFRPNTTFCGCCNRCFAYVEDGQSCMKKSMTVQGGPPVLEPHCRPGSTCLNDVCKRSSY